MDLSANDAAVNTNVRTWEKGFERSEFSAICAFMDSNAMKVVPSYFGCFKKLDPTAVIHVHP